MLNKETARYIYRVLALKTLLENSSRHKLQTVSKAFYGIPLIAFKIDSAITDLTSFSVSLGYTYNLLKIFNPWLRTNKLSNPDKKTYIINFPKKEYLKNGFTYFEGDLVRENIDSTIIDSALQIKSKTDSLLLPADSEKEEKNLNLKDDTDKNEQPR